MIESWQVDGSTFNKYGLASGLVSFFSMFGTFLVTCVVCKINHFNWEKAYWLSFVLILFCFLLRRLPYCEPIIEQENELLSSSDSGFWRNFIACMLISAAMSGLYYFNTVFIGIYFYKCGVINFKVFSELYLFIYMFATLFWGWLSDFFEHLYLFILVSCLVLFISLIFTLYFCNPYLHCFNIFILAMYAGPSHAYFFKLFSKKYRYRGIAVSYSLGTAFIGSSAPLIAFFLISNIYFICLYLSFLFALSICGVLLSHRTLRNLL